MSRRVAAIIPAAGAGRRMGGSTPKQFLLLEGVPILVHTLRVFESSPLVHEICLVVPPEMKRHNRKDLPGSYGFTKITAVLPGGESRQESVYRGVTSLSQAVDDVVVHDGVRPFLTEALLQRVLDAARGADGAVAAVRANDTPKYVHENGTVASTPDRAGLYLAQTPQVFSRKVLLEAYEKAYADGIKGTDDSALVERLGYRVRIVEGSWENIKITMARDLTLARQILAMRRGEH